MLFYIALRPVASLVSGLAEASLVVAIVHLLFNLTIAVIFLPFIGLVERQLCRLIPDRDAIKDKEYVN